VKKKTRKMEPNFNGKRKMTPSARSQEKIAPDGEKGKKQPGKLTTPKKQERELLQHTTDTTQATTAQKGTRGN